ncbi:MAG: DoxX family membrane protein [Ginsengibacter sp.]
MTKAATTKMLIKTGRTFFATGIIAFGIQQLIIGDFRPEILPPFPALLHEYVVFPLITGIALIIAGIIILGLFAIKENTRKKTCLYLGIYFLLLIVICHIPYNLILSPNKAIHLGVWAPMLKELAFAGGAFVIAGSFENIPVVDKKNLRSPLLEKLIPFGRIFFSITMILYGYSHYLYIDYISRMVPKWFGMPVFWAYFAGTALMSAGICILFKIWIKPVASLLAIMIIIWFIFLHIPDAIRNPYLAKGNEIVSAFDALLFSGVAIVIAFTIKSLAGKMHNSNFLIPGL